VVMMVLRGAQFARVYVQTILTLLGEAAEMGKGFGVDWNESPLNFPFPCALT